MTELGKIIGAELDRRYLEEQQAAALGAGNLSEQPEIAQAGGFVKFPETADAERRRVGQYFAEHPVPFIDD